MISDNKNLLGTILNLYKNNFYTNHINEWVINGKNEHSENAHSWLPDIIDQ